MTCLKLKLIGYSIFIIYFLDVLNEGSIIILFIWTNFKW